MITNETISVKGFKVEMNDNFKSLSVQINKQYVDLIDLLIETGYFKNRCDFFRMAIDEFLNEDSIEGALLDKMEELIRTKLKK